MKISTVVTLSAAFLISISADAQEPSWNEAQAEVWALMEQSWADDVAENGKWPSEYVHDKYVSWGDNTAAPRYRDTVLAWSRFSDEGDTAIIHYNITTVSENQKGERTQSVRRATEILVRVGQDWKWLAAAGYEAKLND